MELTGLDEGYSLLTIAKSIRSCQVRGSVAQSLQASGRWCPGQQGQDRAQGTRFLVSEIHGQGLRAAQFTKHLSSHLIGIYEGNCTTLAPVLNGSRVCGWFSGSGKQSLSMIDTGNTKFNKLIVPTPPNQPDLGAEGYIDAGSLV
jgi:hypothetical protein